MSEERLRQPPQSLEAEQSVLGALLLDPNAFDLAGPLPESVFHRDAHRVLFARMQANILASKPFDVVTLTEQLRDRGELERVGGADYINALSMAVPSARNIARHAALVREKAALRAVITAAEEASTAAFGGKPVAEVVDAAASSFAAIQRGQVTKMPRSLAEIAMKRVDHYGALERGEVAPGWPTRLPSLDRMLNGGLRPGGLYILAARPAIGKSSLSLALGITLAEQGLPCLFLSQEMPDEEVADRAVVHAGRVDYSDLMAGRLSNDGWTRAAESLEKLAHLPMHVDDQPALTIGDIRAKARAVKGCKVLVLDYLQLCASGRTDDTRNSQIEELTRGLKALAKSEGMAILALSQLNRTVDKRAGGRPVLSDLRDSGAIEQDADVVMFLWEVRPLGDRKVIGLAVEKNRQGATGKLALDFHGATQHWGESTAEIDPPDTFRRRKQEEFE